MFNISEEKLRGYKKWGAISLLSGMIVGGALFTMLNPDIADSSELFMGILKAALGGGISLMLLTVGSRFFLEQWYDSSADVQLRKAALAHDPKLVHGLLIDIKDGEEGAAYNAIALLANYNDPEVTERMLRGVIARLDNRKVLTMDRYAILRHAIKSVQNTRDMRGIKVLKILLENENPDISSMAIRLGIGTKSQTDATLR